jgi:hypothetical protein
LDTPKLHGGGDSVGFDGGSAEINFARSGASPPRTRCRRGVVLGRFASGCGAAELLWCWPLLVACASAAPARPSSASDASPERSDAREFAGPASAESEIGGLSLEDIERELQKLEPRFSSCVRRATDGASFIGGSFSLRLRLDRRGNVRWAYLADNTLGDREAERCVLAVAKGRTWPRPLSGEGLAETSFVVEPGDEPAAMPSGLGTALRRRASALTRRCRAGLSGTFRATAYFGPSGDLLSVGVSPPDEAGEVASDCIAEALGGLRAPRLGRNVEPAAKVTFRLD